MSREQPRIIVRPTEALVDESVSVRMEHFEPGAEIALRSETTDENGVRWASAARFVVDHDGSVDMATSAPHAGTWTDVDPMGFIWSMTIDESAAGGRYHQPELEPSTVILAAEVEGRPVATAQLQRLFVHPGVTRTDIRDGGLVGTLYEPADGTHRDSAGVLVLGGSLGGFENARAALLASRGHPALSLAYFGVDSRPDELVGIELEYFFDAIDWMIQRRVSRPGRLVLMGTSRGGELVLLLASRSPEIGGVIAYVPSGVVHYGIPSGGDRRRIATSPDPASRPPAWTFGGEPIVGAPVTFDRIDFADPPVRFRPGFLGGLEDEAGIEAASIPLGGVEAPVLMFSAGDDHVWPSPELARIAEQGLTSSERVEHIVYADAGHNIGHPHMPATTHSYIHPLNHLDMALGGRDAGDAHANTDSWSRVVDFLTRI